MYVVKTCEEIIRIAEANLDKVDHQCKYLGTIRSNDVSCTKDLKARSGIAKQRMLQYIGIPCNNQNVKRGTNKNTGVVITYIMALKAGHYASWTRIRTRL